MRRVTTVHPCRRPGLVSVWREKTHVPVEVTADYGDGSRSRGLAALGALFLLKAVLLLPHALIIGVLNYAAVLISYIGYWIIAFTGALPEFFYRFPERSLAWQVRTSGWLFALRDEYPPFEWEPADYGVVLAVTEPPGPRNRALALLGIFLIKFLALIPQAIVFGLVGIVAFFAVWIAYFVILFTGRYPMGLFEFALGTLRWSARLTAWAYSLTDRYPPFRLST